MRIWSILKFYFKIRTRARKIQSQKDSTYQLIQFAKYGWIFFSVLVTLLFGLYINLSGSSDEFFTVIELTEDQFIFRGFFYVCMALFLYHFFPVLRKHTIIISKHFPYPAGIRYLINFCTHALRLSNVNILLMWLILWISNPSFFSTSHLAHGILQLIGAMLPFSISSLSWSLMSSLERSLSLKQSIFTFSGLRAISEMIKFSM